MNHITTIEAGKKYLYENFHNIEVEIVNEKNSECYIFFSSNGLYEENSFEEFEKTMLKGNRYEWKSIAVSLKKRKNIGKIIYVRDVYKNHYINGVNSSLSSIEKTVEYLRKFTPPQYAVTTIGISSGGYMAVIAGCKLQAKRIFCISGQFDLNKHLPEENLNIFRNINPKYCRIDNLIANHNNIPVYYFCPIGCSHDYENYKLVKDIENVICFLFPDEIHAATVYPFNFPDLLCLSNERLNKLEKHYHGKTINKNEFLLRTMSLLGFIEFCRRLIKSRLNIGYLKELWDVKK